MALTGMIGDVLACLGALFSCTEAFFFLKVKIPLCNLMLWRVG